MNTNTSVVPLQGGSLAQHLGALLLHADEPVSTARLSEVAEADKAQVNWALDRLAVNLEACGLVLQRVADKVTLLPSPSYQHFIDRYNRDNQSNILLVLDEYLQAKTLKGMSATSLKEYRLTLKNFLLYFGKQPENITTKDVRRYLMGESNKGNSVATISAKISKLKSFFSWLEREDYIEKDPMRKIDKPKASQSKPKYLTHEQIELLRETAEGIDRVIIEVLYATGLRVSEAVNLDWRDVDFSAKLIQVRNGKGGKDRTVPLSTKASMVLLKYKESRTDSDECVFRSQYRRRMSKETIERRVKNLGKKVGLPVALTPHKLRHSLATHLLDSGMKLEEVQMVLGHSEVSTTQIYAKTQFANTEHSYRKFMP